MKFDKETVFAFILCLGMILVWGIYSKKANEKMVEEKRVEQESVAEKADAISSDAKALAENNERHNKPVETPIKNDTSTSKEDVSNHSKTEHGGLNPSDFRTERLGNSNITCEISVYDSSIERVEFLKFLDQKKTKNISFGYPLNPFDGLKVSIGDSVVKDIKVENKDGSITVIRTVSAGGSDLKIKQSFSLKGEYIVGSEISFLNVGSERVSIPALKVSAGSISDFKSMGGDQLQSEYFSINTCLASGGAVKSKPFKGKEFDEQQENPARWIALSNKYFCSILMPQEPFPEGNMMIASNLPTKGKNEKQSDELFQKNLKDNEKPKFPYISSQGILPLDLAPGETKTFSMSIFLGPKERPLLKSFDESATKVMHLGWNWLEPISQLLLSFLVKINKFVGNYGWSIIILTILIKLAFWPLAEKANTSARNMQKLQPIIQEIKEKYKGDPQKMHAKTMEIYKEHGVNPFGGCLPALLQLPVLFALYNTIGGAVEIRQSSFLWAIDLTRPDSLFIPGIPIPVNPLVLLMAGTMFLQQKMTPAVADPVQQKMMMLMPLIMLVMFYSVPSGLTLYWTVSQIISIIQLGMSKYMPLIKKTKGIA
ncbi:MAG TPA: membrane protein insertase YidC [Victivallales bacterium]|nr:membrane protein insertase YidC [Victivallales bacterium]